MSELPSALRDRILAQAKAEPAETQRVRSVRIYVYIALGIAASLGLFLALGGMKPGARSPAYLAGVAGSGLVLLTGFGALALGRRTAASVPTSRYVLSAIGFPLGWALATFALLALWPLGGSGVHVPRHDAMCAVLSIALGVGPLAALLFARRRTVFVSPSWVGAALGATSFTWGAVLMTLVCICSEPLHMLFGHVVPAALAGAILGALGGRVLAFRAR